MRTCDLHTHSVYSDGADTPRLLLEKADAAGLSAIALTDHNTVDGLCEFLAEAERFSLEAIPGVELSVDYSHDERVDELHVVCLYLPKSAYSQITLLAEDMKQAKIQSNILLTERLVKAGYDVDYEEAAAMTLGIPNRAHIAKILTQKGYTASEREAFATVLSKEAGFYVEPPRPDVFMALDMIRSFGGVSILAHPFLNLDAKSLAYFLPKAKDAGLMGMETLYPLFDLEETALATSLASEFSLLCSGGSDYHGANKPDLSLGRGKGDLFVPLSFAEAIKQKAIAF